MTHYYTDNKELKSEQIEFKYVYDSEEFVFRSDHGVFSKDGIDYGSYLLLKCIKNQSLGDSILDLGCGYGAIGIILSRFNPYSKVDLVDVNSRATELATLNGKINNVEINVYKTNDINTLETQYTTVVLNPPIRAGKCVIFELYEKAHLNLQDNGRLFIVIQKKHGAESSLKKLKSIFKTVNILDKIHGHWIIEAIK